MFTLIVGDVTDGIAKFAKSKDSAAYLIHADNIYDQHSGTGYVSIGDLSNLQEFYDVLAVASKIIYFPPDKWSDNKTSSDKISMAWLSEKYINIVSTVYNIPVENSPCINTMGTEIIAQRKSNKQLWVFGCSTTFGTGVPVGERYSDHLATNLNLESTVTAIPGSSIRWAANEILRADIRGNDIVVWGLTTIDRFPWYHNGKLNHVNVAFYKERPFFNNIVSLDSLDSDNSLYQALVAVRQVDNHCSKVGAKLVLAGIHANIELSEQLLGMENYVMLHGQKGIDMNSSFLDLGSDNSHPGKLTHKMYSDKIFKKIKDLGWY